MGKLTISAVLTALFSAASTHAATIPIEINLQLDQSVLARPAKELNSFIDLAQGIAKCAEIVASGNPFSPISPDTQASTDAAIGLPLLDYSEGDSTYMNAEYSFAVSDFTPESSDRLYAKFQFDEAGSTAAKCEGMVYVHQPLEDDLWTWVMGAYAELAQSPNAEWADDLITEDRLISKQIGLCELSLDGESQKQTLVSFSVGKLSQGVAMVSFSISAVESRSEPPCDLAIMRLPQQ